MEKRNMLLLHMLVSVALLGCRQATTIAADDTSTLLPTTPSSTTPSSTTPSSTTPSSTTHTAMETQAFSSEAQTFDDPGDPAELSDQVTAEPGSRKRKGEV
jgi:hypothetical protein